jgi:MFS family permease
VTDDALDTEPPRSVFAPALRTTTIGLLILITLVAFEATAVSAALPTAARDLHGLGSYGFAFTGFLVANVVGMVAAGQLTDRHGAGRPLLIGLIGFVAGLVLAGTATTMEQLIVGRVVQGFSGGLIGTAVYVVIGQVYADDLRPRIFAAISSAWVVPSLVGPLVSGLLAQHATWRLVFLGLVPFALLGGVLTAPTLRTLHAAPHGAGSGADRWRLLRALAVAIGVATLGVAADHPSPLVLVAVPFALALMVWGLRRLLPPGTLQVRPGVAAPIALRGLLAGAFFGVESLVPLSLTVQHGFGAAAAGLPLTASGISWSIGSWWQSRPVADDGISRRIALIRAGFACLTVGALGMAVTALPSSPGWLAYPSWMVSGLGMGFAMSSLGVVLLRFTSDRRRGEDSAALQLSDATSSAITTGLAGMLVAAASRGAIGYTGAFVTLDITMGAVAVLGVAVAGRTRPAERPSPAATTSVGLTL